MHGKGGMPKNLDNAFKFLKLAADQFYAPAEYNLSTLYNGAEGFDRDKKLAKYWLDRYSVNTHKSTNDFEFGNTENLF